MHDLHVCVHVHAHARKLADMLTHTYIISLSNILRYKDGNRSDKLAQ